ncbi:transmembrane-type terpene cyclase [Jidongwangia harbinensis]|uniref:transmembrane-type terpene cyclase n=1 Tax=Jidongwangia harbinensis TaxID=2878561 RepID=UPI003FD8E609
MLTSGIAWTVVYVEAIRVGRRDRTYAIPVLALTLNFAWEATYAVVHLTAGVSMQGVVNLVWALADVVIVHTYLRYGRRELPATVTRDMFVGWSVLVFGAGFAVQWLFLAQFGARYGGAYSAFLQNALMSGLFIAMFVGRGGLRGQSMLIAVGKWIGTLAPTIVFGVLFDLGFVLGLGLLCCVLDLVYIGLVRSAARRPDGRTHVADPPVTRRGGGRSGLDLQQDSLSGAVVVDNHDSAQVRRSGLEL